MECSIKEKIANESSRIEEDSEHSFKAHYNASDKWGRTNLALGLLAALIGAISGGASSAGCSQALVTATAFIATALITCMTFLKPNEKSESHKNAGNLYQSLRNQTRIFREIELDETMTDTEAKKKLALFCNRREELNTTMPSIPRQAYEKAKKDIDEGRANYKVDKGI